ncbi:hypothetical protein [Salibacterium lacus]|uniref:DUF3995 domain-containing protein n=1 Tax=Salibacterium lacus TaxID=1898109 RepID=A0ABW5T5A5_9BACI
MIWTIFQALTLVILGVCTSFGAWWMDTSSTFGPVSTGPVPSIFDVLLAVAVPLTAFYFLTLFELHKENHIFYQNIWKRAPFLIGTAGLVSFAALAVWQVAFNNFPDPWVVIVLYQYFLLLLFLWVFSLFFKRMKQNDTVTKAAELAATYSVWVVLVFLALFYVI